MDNFTFFSPTFFDFGKDAEKEVGKRVKQFDGKRVLLHYGGGSVVKSGLLDRVKKSLAEENITYVELGGVVPNPRSGLVYEGIRLYREEVFNFVLAVGGGSVIDSAKAIAAGALYEGDFWDFYSGDAELTEALPVGTILTIPAAGSEGSLNSVITHEDGMLKRGAAGECLRPKFSILNPKLVFTLPAYQSACGAVDIMAHVLERYFTNTPNVAVTDHLCEAVLNTVKEEIPKVLDNANDYDAQANIMWAGMVAHNNICGVGREQDWATHDLEHELSALYDVAHGAGLAVMFPAWMRYNVDHDIMRFANLAVRVWGCTMNNDDPKATALEGIECFVKFLSSIGMPVTFKELGAKEDDIPKLVRKLGVTGHKSIGSFVKLYEKDAEAIYRLAL
ncbi:MAG: iron-containing alcohol dehydrogenase [Lachnoclostridium sp.]|jgi:alcohol dehydrogenase YqhD (iron-dependent ADH family)|nr:iron-containing alcohol dehydrogenase [Lachnoclostridium sp.]